MEAKNIIVVLWFEENVAQNLLSIYDNSMLHVGSILYLEPGVYSVCQSHNVIL